MSDHSSAGFTWLAYALMTVGFWGLYGIFLHSGVMGMNTPGAPPDPNARYKAFLFVGIAYFLTAVLAPLAILLIKGSSWSMPMRGMSWSLIAGIVGAAGAFCVLLAFAAKGSPSVVMAIIFAGAPIINAFVALWLHPPAGGFAAIPKPFFIGIVLAAAGGCLVTLYKPPPGKTSAAVPVQTANPPTLSAAADRAD